MSGQDFQSIVFAMIAVAGCIVFLYELYKRRVSESEQRKEDLDFQKKKFEHEKAVWDEQDRYLGRQISKFESIIDQVASRLKVDLVQDTHWLVNALRRSELHPYQDTIFGERSEHFHSEKDRIARVLSASLVRYFENLLERYDRICVVIDSGTTLFPFFNSLGELALQKRVSDPRPRWIDRIEIITNNIPGLVKMMQIGRPGRDDGVAGLPLHCTMLAGQPLTEYAAATGPDTLRSLSEILEERRKTSTCYAIALVTGNWIRIRKSDPICPVPMARGIGHLEFKQLLMHLANEVFVVAPLGKIFANATLDDINNVLALSADAVDVRKAMYEEIDTEHPEQPVAPSKVRLVTTMRSSNSQLLRAHGVLVADRFSMQAADNVHKIDLARDQSRKPIFVPFDHDETDDGAQLLLEFPHAATRKTEFFRYFQV